MCANDISYSSKQIVIPGEPSDSWAREGDPGEGTCCDHSPGFPSPRNAAHRSAGNDKLSPHIRELLAFAGELFQQRCGLERVTHRCLKLLHLGEHLVEADLVAEVH